MLHLCKRFLKYINKRLKRVGIVQRMIAGYVLIIFIPTIVIGTMWYNQAMDQLYSENIEGRKQVTQQMISNLQVSLRQVERLHTLFQYNSHTVDYLLNMAPSTAEEVYLFMKYIRPLFNNVLLGNETVQDLAIYKFNNRSEPISPEFKRAELFPYPDMIGTLELSNGKWLYTQDGRSYPVFTYYQTIYSHNFSSEIGVLEITLQPEATRHIFNSNENGSRQNLYFLDDHQQIVYAEEHFSFDDEVTDYWRSEASANAVSQIVNDRWIVQRMSLNELSIDVILVSELHRFVDVAQKRRVVLIGSIFIMLLVLTISYYMMARSVTRRIVSLARHMRKVGYDTLPKFPEPKHMDDEIGDLITSFNRMISRLDSMINKVHRSELRQKEAAFMALQAQIKPHFLYNTLESIRMLAEIDGNEKISELAYSFGQLLRYTIPRQQQESQLDKEIEHVEHYIKIHQIRVGKRLTFEKTLEINPQQWKCPPLILQPLIENCIVHGLSASTTPLTITLTMKFTDPFLYIKVADDGPGIPADKLEQIRAHLQNNSKQNNSGGIGIVNVNERIRSYYGEGSGISIFRQEEKGTAVLMKLHVGGDTNESALANR